VLGTSFTNRQRSDIRNIAGLFTNLAPLVFSYRPGLALSDWTETVRKRLFETEKYAELPLEDIYDSLRAEGLRPPPIVVLFNMTSEWSEERVGGIVIKRRPPPAPEMPWGFQVYVDPRTPANCRVEFDARLFRHDEVREIVSLYVRLLEIASEHPDLPIGELVGMIGLSARRLISAHLHTFLSKFVGS
jgi:non-ribosomal peptide synthetase component F